MEFLCVGNALVDIISFVEKDFAPRSGFHTSSASHVGFERLDALLAGTPGGVRLAGGGAANTARVLATLGRRATFAGTVGNDDSGAFFVDDLEASGVATCTGVQEGRTGIFGGFLDPDGERTIVVASDPMPPPDPASLPGRLFRSGDILYLDGFVSRFRAVFEAYIGRAERAGMRIAFDVASMRLAVADREYLRGIVERRCEWAFLNEDEFLALYGGPVASRLREMSAHKVALVIKRAEKGAMCVRGEAFAESAVRAMRPLDSTGAGDAFAAGFLSAAVEGADLSHCLRQGNRVAEEVILVPAMTIDPEKMRKAITTVD